MSLNKLTELFGIAGILLLFVQDCDGSYRSYRSYRTYGYYYYYYSSSNTSTIGSIVGGVISGLVFLGIAVAFCVFFCFCRKSRSTNLTPGVLFHNSSRMPQQAVISANTTPGVNYPHYSNSATTLAPGQTFGPPPGGPPNNDAFKPPPPYAGPAPSYDSVFGQTNYSTPPYPTSPS